MRNVTWLVRRYFDAHRPLPIAILVAATWCGAPAAADQPAAHAAAESSAATAMADSAGEDSANNHSDVTSTPAPVLRLARQQPELSTVEADAEPEAPAPSVSSRRTVALVPAKTGQVGGERDAGGERAAGGDGWKPRGMIGRVPDAAPQESSTDALDDVARNSDAASAGTISAKATSSESAPSDAPEAASKSPALRSPQANKDANSPAARDSAPERLPIRRPRIEYAEDRDSGRRVGISRSAPDEVHADNDEDGDATGNDRARRLQEDIERFESADVPLAEGPNDEYDQPSDPGLVEVVPETPEAYGDQSRPAQAPAPIISAAIRRLEQPIAQCLQYYYQRPENARQRTPWGMLHAILPYGLDAQVDTGRRRYNAIAWLAGNNPSRNLKMLATTRDGRLVARSGVGLQGHQAQMLAIFAQAGVPLDYALRVNGRRFTMADLVQAEMAACRSGEELTFTLIGLAHYLPTDTRWRSADGQVWDFERLIREELSQPVVGAACGGTHRLMGFSYALKQRRKEGLPITGQWARAATYLDEFVAYTWQLQNRDGSFSTQWFEGPEDNHDLDRKVQTTGHILEWLVFTLEDDQLQDDRVTRAVTFLSNAMITNRTQSWEVGPKGHALRALSLYHRRVFGSEQPWLAPQTASIGTNGRR